MTMSLDQVLQETRGMPRQQVAEFIDRLTQELHEVPNASVEESWRLETRARMTEIITGTVQGIPEDVVSARVNHITRS